jgi:hypothetical protein
MSPPASINPEPCYVAVSAASQIVTNDHDSHAQIWYDEDEIEPSGETARVSPASLKLVNAFLDQLLYNFLSVARSTSLASLRPAVTEVLKPKLAKEVIAGADQELHEYLGGGADEELVTFHNGQEPTGEWDLELVWKRTRLRVMVYSSLGDMEEEDEEMYAEQENLDNPAGVHGNFTNNPGIVSPAVAIFLTSILEVLGEQVLIVSGQAAYNRLRAEKLNSKRESTSSRSTSTEIADRVVVEELDTEKVAMNPALGRLWRTWRKKLRSPTTSWSRPISRDSYYRRNYQNSFSTSSRRSSMDTLDGASTPAVMALKGGLKDVPEEFFAANIPLPIRDRDVEEIETPWLAIMEDSDDESTKTGVTVEKRRPRSLILPITTSSRGFPRAAPSSETLKASHFSPERPSRGRPSSVPPPQSRELLFPSISSTSEESAKGDGAEAKDKVETNDTVTPPQSETVDSGAQDSESHPDKKDGKRVSQGVVAGMFAGAAALGSAAIAGFASKREESHTASQKPVEDELQVASKPQFESHSVHGETEDEEEPQILESTRLPMEGGKPNEILESRSRAGSRSGPGGPSPTKAANGVLPTQQSHEHSEAAYQEGREEHDPTAIGLARTSNISVPAMKTLPASPLAGPGQPDHESRSLEDDYPESHALTDDDDTQHASNKASVSEEPSKSQFVLAAPPAPRVPRSQSNAEAAAGFLSSESSLAPMSRTPGAEHGVPPLTPLREMMEAAHDTSDEASSIARSHSTSRSERSITSVQPYRGHANGQSISSSHYSHAPQTSDASSKYSENRAQQVVIPFAQSTDRAGVQRVYTPPVTPREPQSQKPRRSDSFTRSQRPTHTSGSATSQVSHKLKGLIGLPHDTSDRSLSNARTSEDERRSNSTDRDGNVKHGHKEDSFEQLIRSDETLQYTLTPQTVRETEAGQPQPSKGPMTSKGFPASFQQIVRAGEVSRSTRQSLDEPARPGTQQSNRSINRAAPFTNGLRSNPPPAQAAVAPVQPNGQSHVKRPYIPKAPPPPPSNESKATRPGMPEARGARTDRNSTRDIADFLRSTGPDGDLAFVERENGARRANGATAPKVSNAGRTNGISSTTDLRSNDPRRVLSSASTNSSRTRVRLEARDAAVPYGHHSSDLADFIRQGPPNGQNRVIANGGSTRPTRTSSRTAPVIDRKSAAAPAVQKSSQASPVQSRAQLAPSSSHSASKSIESRDDDPPVPKRTQRRVRDPYALDSDSEDEETLQPVQPVKREESLLDFLSSAPPPNPAEPKPFTSSATGKVLQSRPQENGNIVSFGRFGRKDSKTSTQLNGKRGSISGSSGAVQPNQSRVTNTAPQISLPPPGRSSPLFNESNGLGMDNYRPNASRGSERAQPSRSGSRGNGAPAYQARGARMDSGRMTDFADFLRTSGPPTSTSTYAPPVKDQGGFSKMFRRKKAVA